MFIYKITNTLNNMIYIGQTNNYKHRVYTHKSYLRKGNHFNNHLQSSWNKYGEKFFSFEMLDQCAFFSSSDNLERFWIKFYNSNNREFGFNKDAGGTLKKEVSLETRALLSKINRENPTKPMLGKKHSEESKNKMRKGKHSQEAREIMSKRASSKTGKDNPFYGKKHSDKFKENMSKLKTKPVLCIDTGIVYKSAMEASMDMSISKPFIAQCCAGRHNKAKGFRFTYNLGLK